VNNDFEADLGRARNLARESRRELLALLSTLADTDLDRSRRGGWTVRQVLEHVIESEAFFLVGIYGL
jgi:hypothetical protein